MDGGALGVSTIKFGFSVVVKIIEIGIALNATTEQTADLLNTILHVQKNIQEARRLYSQKFALLKPEERSRFDEVISDNEAAVRAFAALIEPARVDGLTKNRIGMANKAFWVFRDNPKVQYKHARLSICHQSLIGVITCLHQKDVIILSPAMLAEDRRREPPPPSYEMSQLLNWRREATRKKKKSEANESTDRRMSDPVILSPDSTPPITVSDVSGPSSDNETLANSLEVGDDGLQLCADFFLPPFPAHTPSRSSIPESGLIPTGSGRDFQAIPSAGRRRDRVSWLEWQAERSN